MIQFFQFFELLQVFSCANNIEYLVSSLFGVEIFNAFNYFTSSYSISGRIGTSANFSSHCSGGMGGTLLSHSNSGTRKSS